MVLAPLNYDGWMPGWHSIVIAVLALIILALLHQVYILTKWKLDQLPVTGQATLAPQFIPEVRQLTKHTFELWSLGLKLKLKAAGLLKAIETSLPLEDEVNLMAYNRIANSIPDEHLLSSVITTSSAFVAYNNLKQKYGWQVLERKRRLDRMARLKLRNTAKKLC